MEIHVTDLKASSTRETWELHHLTDTHIDDPDHAAAELKERIAQIKENPKALWFGGGDYGSLILPGDKRFGSGGHLKGEWAELMGRVPDLYLERCVELFDPIADKCVGLLGGNHEATIGRNYHRGLVAELASRLGNPSLYMGDRGWSVLRWHNRNHRVTLKLFGYHGWSTGRLRGRKALQAERDLGAWNADVFLMGHDHQPFHDLWWTQDCVGGKRGYVLMNRPRAWINGGSWTYGQKPPTPADEKIKWAEASRAPGQSWVEGKNFRPQAPDNPYLLVHVDFGHSASAGKPSDYRPAGCDLEIRQRGNRHYLGGDPADEG